MQCKKCEEYVWCRYCRHKSCKQCGPGYEAACEGRREASEAVQNKGIAEAEIVQIHRMNDSDDEESATCERCGTVEEPGYAILSAICHDCLVTECGQCKDHKECPACRYGTCAACWPGHTERCIRTTRKRTLLVTQEENGKADSGQEPSDRAPKEDAAKEDTEGLGRPSVYETRLRAAEACNVQGGTPLASMTMAPPSHKPSSGEESQQSQGIVQVGGRLKGKKKERAE